MTSRSTEAHHLSVFRTVVRIALLAIMSAALAACMSEEPPPGTPSVASASPPAVASARGRVDVDGGIIHLAARRDGVISAVLVEEGERVGAGQLLATLDDDLAQRTLAVAQSEVHLAEQDRRRAQLELASARREVVRLEPLAADESVTGQELDRARDALHLAELAQRTADVALQIAQARWSVAEREVEERRVVAPLDGRIIQRQARPGNGVSTLNVTPLFLFAPDAPSIVRAELEEQYLQAVQVEQRVEVVLEAQPDRRWQGRVQRIGRMVGARTPSDDPGERQDNRVVEVVIALSEADALLIGQRVIVRFLGV